MRIKFAFLILCLLLVSGCKEQQLDPETLRAHGRERAEIASSPDRYTCIESALAGPPIVARALLDSGRYEELEELFAATEAAQERLDPIFSPSQALYEVFDSAESSTYFEHEIELWRRHSPDSKYPKLALAVMRSNTFMRKATGWRTMEERQALGMDARLALKAIREAEQDPACVESPELWEAKMLVATASGAPTEVCEAAFQEVLKRDPQRWSAFGWRANQETPKWTGKAGLHQRMLNRFYKDYGPEAYTAYAVWRFREFYAHREDRFTKSGFEWKRLEEGFDALDKTYPDDLLLLSMRARFALLFGKKEEAAEILERLDGNVSFIAFGTDESWKQAGEVMEHFGGSPEVISYPAGPESRFYKSYPVLQEKKLGVEITRLAWNERFYALEALAESLKQDEILLDMLYDRCRQLGAFDNPESVTARLERWCGFIPESQTARTALATHLVHLGWEARGYGYADTVSDEGWRVLKQRLNEAASLLEAPSDSAGCALRISVAMGRSESLEVVDQMVDLSLKLDPSAIQPVIAKCIYLLPRWGGSKEQVVGFLEETMKERGDQVLLKILNNPTYGDAFHEFASEDMLRRALAAALKEPIDPNLALHALRVDAHGADPQKLEAYLNEVWKQKAEMRWRAGEYRALKESLEQKNTSTGSTAKVVEWGEYRSTLPKPTRLSENKSLPIVIGRSLGVKVRYPHNVSSYIERRVTLERPGPDGPISEERVERFAPFTLLAGKEELILWDLLEKDYQPGKWTLTVKDNWQEIAKQEFQMVDGKGASEPGMRLIYVGAVEWDKEFLMGRPVPGNPKAVIGQAFGVEVQYVGKPKSGSSWWSLPGKPHAEEYDLDCSGVPKGINPRTQHDFILERPDELRPGTWKVGFKVDGREVGEVPIQVDKHF